MIPLPIDKKRAQSEGIHSVALSAITLSPKLRNCGVSARRPCAACLTEKKASSAGETLSRSASAATIA